MKNFKKTVKNWFFNKSKIKPSHIRRIGVFRLITSPFRINPDFIIIGGEKCGTTSLYHYLSQHPAVLSSSTKEVHYFDTNYIGDWWYRAHFPTIFKKKYLKKFNKKVVAGEATPYYIWHPLSAKRIFQDFPKIKLIAILRNPIDRAYSQYNDNKRKGIENLSFEEALKNENERIKGEKEKIIKNPSYNSIAYWAYSYLSKGVYVNQLNHWFQFFPKNQILILDNSQLEKNPHKVLQEIFSFLNISDFDIPLKDKKNVGLYDEMKKETRKFLNEYFFIHNQKLEKLLDKKFLWIEKTKIKN